MENINPCLNMIQSTLLALEAGESLKTHLIRCRIQKDVFAQECSRWYILHEQGGDSSRVILLQKHLYRRTYLMLLQRGLAGESIAESLEGLKNEVEAACQRQIDEHLQLLPFKMLMPLLLLLFPSIMILVIGPLLDSFVLSMSGN